VIIPWDSQESSSIVPSQTLFYSTPAADYELGVEIVENSPLLLGDQSTVFLVNPPLPQGLNLNPTTGVISGTPSSSASNTLYTIAAVTLKGSASATIAIRVRGESPKGLIYTTFNANYTLGEIIQPNLPSHSGGTISDYSVSPPLTSGLNLNPTTGEITGTPSSITALSSFIVTGSNADGSTSTVLNISVSDEAPRLLRYTYFSSTYVQGVPIATNTPTNEGGMVVGYSVAPTLPSGLSLNSSTGEISGIPIFVTPSTFFTVTATNSGGSTSTLIEMTVHEGPPTSLTYSLLNPDYNISVPISANTPSNSGGFISTYSVSPALPAGLQLNTSTGIITGTPSIPSIQSNYTVTGSNSSGSTSVTLGITVKDTPPSLLAYGTQNAIYTINTPITSNSPSHSGGGITSYSISPSLPAGLSLNTSSGIISGNPTVISSSTSYQVTAHNSGGNISTTLTITVIDVAPSVLSYSSMAPTYVKGTAIPDNLPTNSGGQVISYSVSPSLPTGLLLNSSTGVLSGTSTQISVSTPYIITATNSGGSTTTTLNIRVNDIAPTSLSYSNLSPLYVKGTAIAANSPTHSGGTITDYSVSPSLPTGLTLNSSTGLITGTATVISAEGNYLITGTNSGGSTTTTLTIQVDDAAPASLTYSALSPSYTLNLPITDNTPISTGGVITDYSVSPALPSGISLNSSTGVIHGTPTSISPATNYLITGSNASGNITSTLTLTVIDTPPSSFTYSTGSPIYTKGSVISPNTPNLSGGAVTNYSVSPSLPSGLLLNSTSGIITGTPTGIVAETLYTVTAANTGGSTTATLALTVNDIPPSTLSYSEMSAVYTRGTVITNNTPTASGGPIVSYSSSPPLPSGLILNSSSGMISGTPNGIVIGSNYTITATNSGGSTTVDLNITVNDIPPSSLAYSSMTPTYLKGVSITANSPSNTGGAIVSYSISPSLPSGLTLNSSTGIITGTASNITPSQSYEITGTNSGGSIQATLIVQVNDIAPTAITYSAPSFAIPKGVAITESPTFSGGTPTSYSIGSMLPNGLALNTSNGTIFGIPSVTQTSSSYSIAGSNVTGSVATSLSMSVTQATWFGRVATTPAFGSNSSCSSTVIGDFTSGYCTGGSASSGSDDGMMNSPSSIYINGSSTLYVADSNNHRISAYDLSTGSFLGWIGKVGALPTGGMTGCESTLSGQVTPGWCIGGTSQSGSGDGMFNTPTGITGDGTYLYVVDQGNYRIIKFVASTGAFIGWAGVVGTLPTGGANGCTLALPGSFTQLWCTGGSAAQESSSLNGGLKLPVGITVDNNSNLYVTDQSMNSVNRYSASSGAFKGWIGKIGAVRPLLGGLSCTLAPTNAYTPGWCTGGTSASGNGDGSFNGPTGIATDQTSIYVGNANSDQVGKYNASSGAFLGWIGKVSTTPTGGATGCATTSIGNKTPGWCTGGSSTAGTGDGQFTNPVGATIDSDSHLLVSDTGNNRIMKFNASSGAFIGWTGNILTSPTGGETGCASAPINTGTLGWCTGGTAQSGSGNAMFNSPYGLSSDSSDHIYVSDGGNSRIVKLTP
jgi:hypothetical protein